MAFNGFRIRMYDAKIDRSRVEDLQKKCEVGPKKHVFFAETNGDPICRIRNSPMYNVLVAQTEENDELVGVIQGSIKWVTIGGDLAKMGYILGLRVSPTHRRKGIGLNLANHLHEWFTENEVDYAYMATEKDNLASVNLFINKLGFVKVRTPTILVHPIKNIPFSLSSNVVNITKLETTEQAEILYRNVMGSTDFFPHDIDAVLKNKLSLGTWVACARDDEWSFDRIGRLPSSWAMVSVWNSGELFKLRVEKSTWSCFLYGLYATLIGKLLPCLQVSALPDFVQRFGFYFIYGVHCEGPLSGKLVRSLFKFVHNMGRKAGDCKVIVTEVGGGDAARLHIPHWKLLSCPEDLWCIKGLKDEVRNKVHDLRNGPHERALFVDPREV